MPYLLTHAVNSVTELLQVANDLRRGCVGSDCKTGGDVLTVFWAVLQVQQQRTSLVTDAIGLSVSSTHVSFCQVHVFKVSSCNASSAGAVSQ
jgi:hypothetical protein